MNLLNRIRYLDNYQLHPIALLLAASLSVLVVLWLIYQISSLVVLVTKLPLSDYVEVLGRYDELMSGKLNIFDFFFLKHVDHNHFFVYLLGLLDIYFNSGRQTLLLYWTIASNSIVFIYFFIIIRKVVDTFTLAFAATFAASQVFGIHTAEIWAFPFQVVLASFRLFLVLGLSLVCLGLVHPRSNGPVYFAPGIALLLIAALSHGSGVMIFPLIALVVALMFQRIPSGLRKYYVLSMIIPLILFLLHNALYPPATSFIKIFTNIPVMEFPNVPVYLSFLLGYYFLYLNSEALNIAAGLGGIILLLYFCLNFLIKKGRYYGGIVWWELFFLLWGIFSLGGALLSVLINLGYMDFRGVEHATYTYFLASRYSVTTSGFWLPVVALTLSAVRRRGSRLASASAMSALAASVTLSVLNSASIRYGWQNAWAEQSVTEAAIRCDVGPQLEPHDLEQKLYLPKGMYEAGISSLAIQKNYKLGPFASTCRQRAPVAVSDVNWNRGVGRVFAGLLVFRSGENTEALTPGRSIKFHDGTQRKILNREIDSIYLRIILDGEPLDGDVVGYPHEFEIVP